MTTRREYLESEGIPVDEIVGVVYHQQPIGGGQWPEAILTGDHMKAILDEQPQIYDRIQYVYTLEDVWTFLEEDDVFYVKSPRNPPGVPRREET